MRAPPPACIPVPAGDLVGGVDEAGRGPLAGAVVAAVVVLAPGQVIEGVRDSKLLTARARETAAARIREQALAWALGRAEAAEIDALNILNATFLAMQRAVAALGVAPALLQVDGNRAPAFPGFVGPVQAVIGGDRSCPAISAASILAKVARDAEMLRLHEAYPGYGFARHKGYPTADHRAALARFGPCAAHRRSFRPVREALGAAAP
ncbi:MAG: ribonuclease HII [Gammaproteobacteria bacterium]|nr:ribonuclease HII [Gammaproteobacteria bacterium]